MKRNEWLSRTECAALRGIAILGIMLHNYCHWLSIAVKENEYTFSIGNVRGLHRVIAHPDAYLPVHLLSFFGHYGVPVFLFLSGFGLVMKYEQEAVPTPPAAGGTPSAPSSQPAGAPSFGRFVIHHYRKLFSMMIAGFVAFIIVDAITPGSFHFRAANVIAQLLMVTNLLARPDHIIWPGPYWFFGLMMQLYIVYRLLIFRRSNAIAVALVAVCWLMQAVCEPEGDALNRLRYNCIGGMMPFCAGVLLARMRPADIIGRMHAAHWSLAAVVTMLLVYLLSNNYFTWAWVPLFVIAASVAAVKAMPGAVLKTFAWTGAISAAMFVTHPILRKIFIPISQRGDVYDGLVLYIIASVAVAVLFNRLINRA